jgi:hypothetical protein
VIGVNGDGREQLVAGAAKGGIARSEDGGDTWQVGLPTAAFVSLSPTYPHDGLIAVVGDQGNFVVRSAGPAPVLGSGGAYLDESFMFSPAYPAAGSNAPALLVAFDKQTGQPGVVACDARLTCTGARAPLATTTTMPSAVTLFPSEAFASDGVVWAQSSAGVWRSTDGGRSFVPLTIGQPGATQSAIPGMALAPGYGSRGNRTAYVAVWQVFADKTPSRNPQTTTRGGIYRTTDGGASWSNLSAGAPKFETGAFAVAAAPAGRLFGAWTANGSRGGVMCSTDAGSTWADACPPLHAGSTAASGAGTCPGGNGCAGPPVGSTAAPGSGAGGAANRGNSTSGAGSSSGGGAAAVGHMTTMPAQPGISAWQWAVIAALAVCGGLSLSLIGWQRTHQRRRGG